MPNTPKPQRHWSVHTGKYLFYEFRIFRKWPKFDPKHPQNHLKLMSTTLAASGAGGRKVCSPHQRLRRDSDKGGRQRKIGKMGTREGKSPIKCQKCPDVVSCKILEIQKKKSVSLVNTGRSQDESQARQETWTTTKFSMAKPTVQSRICFVLLSLQWNQFASDNEKYEKYKFVKERKYKKYH